MLCLREQSRSVLTECVTKDCVCSVRLVAPAKEFEYVDRGALSTANVIMAIVQAFVSALDCDDPVILVACPSPRAHAPGALCRTTVCSGRTPAKTDDETPHAVTATTTRGDVQGV